MSNSSILHSDKFSDGNKISHGFSTRSAGDATTEEQAKKVVKELGFDPNKLQLMRQVHKDGIVEVKEKLSFRPEADSLITNKPGIMLGIRTADCVPVLIHDPINNAIAAVHAGWRSAAAKLPAKTLEIMHTIYKTDPSKCHVFIGPSIGACCYEVGEEVILNFDSQFIKNKRFNLPAAVCAQLEEEGVLRPKIFLTNECTSCNKDLFYSHRRDKGETGRHLSFIMLCSQ